MREGGRRRRWKTKLLLLFVLLPQLLIVSSSSPPFVFGRTEFGGTFWTRFQSGPSCWLVSFGGLRLASKGFFTSTGGVAQMVERSLSMREVPGSIPGASSLTFFPSRIRGKQTYLQLKKEFLTNDHTYKKCPRNIATILAPNNRFLSSFQEASSLRE